MDKFRHHSYFQKDHRTHSYLFPHACFQCRNAFKKTQRETARSCPDCGAPMIQLSRKFKPPKKNDVQSWAVVEYVVQAGFSYQSIQNEDGRFVQYPSTLKEAEAFVLTHKIHTAPNSNQVSQTP